MVSKTPKTNEAHNHNHKIIKTKQQQMTPICCETLTII
jgi:hypothetical protein